MTCTHNRLAIVSLAILTVSLFAVSAQAAVVGLWTFEEYAGEATVPTNGFIEDTSGNARHMLSALGRGVAAGSTPGSTALGFSSNAGDFLEFIPGLDGTNFQNSTESASSSDIVIGSSGDPSNYSYTLEAILTLPQDNSQGADEGGIMGKGAYNSTSDVDEWNLIAVKSGSHANTVQGFVADGKTNTDPGITVLTNATNLDTGFRHIALVRDRGDDHLHFYLDGVLKDTQAATGSIDVTNALGNFVIGKNNAGGNKRYRGLIDMVRISTDALDPVDFWSNPPIPEPSSLILLTAGLGCLALRRKRC